MDLKSDTCAGGGPSQKKLKPDSYYCDLSTQSLPPMTSLNQSFNMNSPNSSSVATTSNSTNANTSATNPANFINNTSGSDLNKSNSRLFDLNAENQRVLVRSDTNWAPASNCDPLIHCGSSSLSKSTSLALSNHQTRPSQHQMINQDYFSPNNSMNHNSYSPMPESKVKSYFSPFINSNQQQPHALNHQSFSNNYITSQPDRNYGNQMNLNLNAFDDNLTGFSNSHLNHSHQGYNTGQMQQHNSHLNQHHHQHKTTSHSNFNDPLNGSGLPAASSMINTIVEDMTGTFSNSFAHEIIKSVDDNLFSFEEGLVCNFDIDQLDDATANDVTLNAFYSSLKL